MFQWIRALRKKLSSLLDGDRLLYAVLLVVAAVIVLCALFGSVQKTSDVKRAEPVDSPDGCWNTQPLVPAADRDRAEAEALYAIERVYEREEDFPKGLRIEWAGILDSRVLVVFERYRDLNRALDRDDMVVYDVDGRWLYGLEGKLVYGGDGVRIALRPEEEGILICTWRGTSTGKDLYLLIGPDGEKRTFTTEEDVTSQTPAYWSSPYTVVHTKESRLVIENRATGVQTTLFDHSDAYSQMYPKSSEIDEGDQWMYDALIPIFVLIIFIMIFPKLVDKPELKRKGIREPHGDLRDRWR